jgi:hypothetical protein
MVAMTGPAEREVGPKKFVPAYVTTDLAHAEMVKNTLIAEGIQCELERQTQEGFAEIVDVRVLVRKEDFDRARSAIEIRDRGPNNA